MNLNLTRTDPRDNSTTSATKLNEILSSYKMDQKMFSEIFFLSLRVNKESFPLLHTEHLLFKFSVLLSPAFQLYIYIFGMKNVLNYCIFHRKLHEMIRSFMSWSKQKTVISFSLESCLFKQDGLYIITDGVSLKQNFI